MDKKRIFFCRPVCLSVSYPTKTLIPRVTVPDCDARVLSRLSRTSNVRTFPFEKDLDRLGEDEECFDGYFCHDVVVKDWPNLKILLMENLK
jgi:hypothetical protein